MEGTSITWVLSFRGHKTGVFKHRRAVSFYIRLCSDPLLHSHESLVMTKRVLSQA